LDTHNEEESAMTSQTCQLVMRAGPSPGRTYTLSKSDIVIGRDVNVDLVINTAEVSRRHARLFQDAGIYVVEDLGSTNGTFVNGMRVTTPMPLRSGDIIMLGEAATLVYEESQYDPNATMVAPSNDMSAFPATVAAPAQQIVPSPPPQDYAGQVPAGPAPQISKPITPSLPKKRSSVSWLWAGVGCLVVFLCVVVVGLLIFDTLDLYCVPPFDMLDPLYNLIGGNCPP
jgi:hypothetical protein